MLADNTCAFNLNKEHANIVLIIMIIALLFVIILIVIGEYIEYVFNNNLAKNNNIYNNNIYDKYRHNYHKLPNIKYRIITIEGNIGAGKSTFINLLKNKYKNKNNIVFLLEPVSIWESIKTLDGKNMIENLYENTKKFAFSFQIMACGSRIEILKNAIQQHQRNNEDNILTIVMERSLDADHNVFAKMLYDENSMRLEEYQIYDNLANCFIKEYGTNHIIWIDVSPQNCYNQIKTRQRLGEQNVSLDYLKMCHDYHESWLSNINCTYSQEKTNITKISNFHKMDLSQIDNSNSDISLLINNINDNVIRNVINV